MAELCDALMFFKNDRDVVLLLLLLLLRMVPLRIGFLGGGGAELNSWQEDRAFLSHILDHKHMVTSGPGLVFHASSGGTFQRCSR